MVCTDTYLYVQIMYVHMYTVCKGMYISIVPTTPRGTYLPHIIFVYFFFSSDRWAFGLPLHNSNTSMAMEYKICVLAEIASIAAPILPSRPPTGPFQAMPERLQAVIKADGKHTKFRFFLSQA